ncbi:hypothetical protein TY_1 [Pseudomonas phage vB_PaeM_Ty]|nr:hypothetical protein TY_1 [Pseudomonas phage vB_PaeM_Ty]
MTISIVANKAEAQALKDYAEGEGYKVNVVVLSDCVMCLVYK